MITKNDMENNDRIVYNMHQDFTTGRNAGSNSGGVSDGVSGGGSNSTSSNNTRSGIVGGNCDGLERRMVDITRDKPIKVAVRVQVPVRDHPKFNFVGKLLGPKGNSLKRLQEESGCKMAVLGRGSMKDRQKEEELRVSGDPKFSHLNDDLHVEISAYATPAEAHARIAYALVEVRRFLVPDYNDDIRQEQMWEMQMMNCNESNNNPQDAPSSPETSLGPAGSPISSTTGHTVAVANSIATLDNQESSNNSNSMSIVQSVSTPIGGRKRPLVSSSRPTMSPTKRTVMSLLARARAAQNKDHHQTTQIVHNQPPTSAAAAAAAATAAAIHQGTLTMLSQSACQATIVPPCQRIQLIGSSSVIPAQHTTTRRQSVMPGNASQHQILSPTIHGLIQTQRAAAGPPTMLPLL